MDGVGVSCARPEPCTKAVIAAVLCCRWPNRSTTYFGTGRPSHGTTSI